jgi:hypothetical protein
LKNKLYKKGLFAKYIFANEPFSIY